MSNSGGPAFPTKNYKNIQPIATGYSEGMTLRDYFAAKVLQGYISMESIWISIDKKDISIDTLCGSAYDLADAMLKARDK